MDGWVEIGRSLTGYQSLSGDFSLHIQFLVDMFWWIWGDLYKGLTTFKQVPLILQTRCSAYLDLAKCQEENSESQKERRSFWIMMHWEYEITHINDVIRLTSDNEKIRNGLGWSHVEKYWYPFQTDFTRCLPGELNEKSLGLFTKEWITFRNSFRNVILTLSWIESLILPFVNAKLFQIRLFKREKKGVLDRDPPRKADFTLCECKALSERESCVRILEMRAEATHGSICAVWAKYYLAVRRSCSWLGRRLQCLWTHIVQITKRIAIRNGFRNVIRSFVNRPIE